MPSNKPSAEAVERARGVFTAAYDSGVVSVEQVAHAIDAAVIAERERALRVCEAVAAEVQDEGFPSPEYDKVDVVAAVAVRIRQPDGWVDDALDRIRTRTDGGQDDA